MFARGACVGVRGGAESFRLRTRSFTHSLSEQRSVLVHLAFKITHYITQALTRQEGVAPEGEHLWRLELALPKLDVGGNGLDEGSHRGLVRHALREEVLL